MSTPVRPLPFLWIILPAVSLGFLLWINQARMQRVERLTNLTGAAVPTDANTPTGYAGGLRMLLVPDHNNEGYQWIAQTQLLLAEKKWRLRHVDYDNAPLGREVRSPAPYRWWLAAVAWCDHTLSERSIGLSVEKAALWADPALHVLLLASAAVFTATWFGTWPAVLLSLGLAALFPLGGAFLPGAPTDAGLALALALGSALPLLAGAKLSGATATTAQARRSFLLAGIIGGLGLWVKLSAQAPLLIGVGLGGIAVAVLARRARPSGETGAPILLPWRAWAAAGAATTFISYLLENAPDRLSMSPARLAEIHPLHALAWLGGGEWLARLGEWREGRPVLRGGRNLTIMAFATAALLALPALMLIKDHAAFLAKDAYALQLTSLAGGIEADNLFAWLRRDGFSAAFLAAALPLLLLVPAGGQFRRSATDRPHRTALLLALGPVAVAFGFACWQLSWWGQLDAMLLALAVVLATGCENDKAPPRSRLRWGLACLIVLAPGVYLLTPKLTENAEPVLSKLELESLAERDLAHWLARKVGPDGAIALAPPNLTTSLYFHGGLRGLGSPYLENEEGFRASVRIAGATSADEAQALVKQRRLAYIILPSWDDFLDTFARLGSNQPEHTLMGLLHTWLPPRWLKPLAYQQPGRKGFEDQFVVIFETTDVQDHATHLSRLTEYFIEMEQVPLATMASRTLAETYTSDLGAQIARAQTEIAQRDRVNLAKVLAEISSGLAQAADESLAWDRRVSLSIVLAQANQVASARAQAARCLEEMGEYDMRGLSTLRLFSFLTLCKALGLEVKDPGLKALAKELVPPQVRDAI